MEIATSPTSAPLLVGEPRLARNSVLNLLGQGLPLVSAFFAIPLLIHGLGADRFGVLTLAWMIIGYFSLFDLGLGRALTQVVAARMSGGHNGRAPALAWPALALMFLLGLVGALIVSAVASRVVLSALRIPVTLQRETLHSFYILAAAIPLVVVTTGLAGILAAYQRFGVLNSIRAPMGIYTYLAPVAVLPLSHSLVAVTAALAVGRLLACAAHLAACRDLMPVPSWHLRTHVAAIRPLFHLGAWMTVTNVVGPLMLYLDRFIIGGILSVAAVAYYATPYEMVTKLLILPGAILGVLFPAIAASYQQDHGRMVQLFARGTKYIALTLFPILLLITAFAHEGLQWWLGAEFARYSTPVLQCLAIGVFMNSVAQVFATLVQGVGRPDLSAKLHLLELPIYLLVLSWAIRHYGIVGAAMVWTTRVAVDGILLFWFSSHFLGDNGALLNRMGIGLLIALGGLATPLLIAGVASRIVLVSIILALFLPTAWIMVLDEDERTSIKCRLGSEWRP